MSGSWRLREALCLAGFLHIEGNLASEWHCPGAGYSVTSIDFIMTVKEEETTSLYFMISTVSSLNFFRLKYSYPQLMMGELATSLMEA